MVGGQRRSARSRSPLGRDSERTKWPRWRLDASRRSVQGDQKRTPEDWKPEPEAALPLRPANCGHFSKVSIRRMVSSWETLFEQPWTPLYQRFSKIQLPWISTFLKADSWSGSGKPSRTEVVATVRFVVVQQGSERDDAVRIQRIVGLEVVMFDVIEVGRFGESGMGVKLPGKAP